MLQARNIKNIAEGGCAHWSTMATPANWVGGRLLIEEGECPFGKPLPEGNNLRQLMQQSIQKQDVAVSLFGLTWGVLFSAKQFVALALPVTSEDLPNGGVVGVVVSLEQVYTQLRSDMRIILACLVVNILVITFIGFARFYSLTVRPVEQLIRLADSYEERGLPFFSHQSGGEYRQLHTSLHQMLERIDKDKRKLHQTIQSLEQANKQILATRQEMIQAEKLSSIGRLASGLAHEIGNPISIVQGYIELLKGSCSEAEKKDFISRCEGELARVSTLLRELLDYARPETVSRTALSVHHILDTVIDLLQPQPMMAGIDLICSFEASDDIIEGSKEQLQQIFINILINAADAIQSLLQADKTLQGRICVTTSVIPKNSTTFLLVQITDNGIGVPQEELHHIFDPFYTTKEPGKGTGLGLSVSFSHVESMGGEMHMTNNAECGVTFSLSLPLLQQGDNPASEVAA